ncbi:ovarian-specific serine/threonine-protein kinase Lok-like [Chelonus insularis]|uniref:ovarian-specific serine/threonine-protein kinase Lok-like n=1 Tax=Chelonus insularis TaxID=460826 RepID=UPI00158F11FA|nr:ovarian-specific serine/threonine-protein kinase Lok-like [Chelonus insularis]
MDQDNIDMQSTLPDTQPAETFTQSQHLDSQSQVNESWGQLIPSVKSSLAGRVVLSSIQMTKEIYTFGRDPNCDGIFTAQNILKQNLLMAISKIHFKIIRKVINNKNDKVVYLEDSSQNGTFVNKVKVGRGKRVVLDNNDVISLAEGDISFFKFITETYGFNSLPAQWKSKYVTLRTLGFGACGEVKMVYSKNNFQTYAMKIISKKGHTTSDRRIAIDNSDKILNEVKILQALKHPFIIRMEKVIDTPMNLYIMLEIMEGGELFDRIRMNSGLAERQTKFIFYQIVEAVNYLHNQGITHRDLKPENILLASDAKYPLVKVSDFGLSKLVDAQTMMKTFCGTPMYVAPEILKTGGRGAYTSQVDIWSLGVILYVTLSGCVPFITHNKKMELHDQIINGHYRFNSQFSTVSPEAINLIEGMMTVDPCRRKTIREVLVDQWLQDGDIKIEIRRLLNGYNNENNPPNVDSSEELEKRSGFSRDQEDSPQFGLRLPVAKKPRIN